MEEKAREESRAQSEEEIEAKKMEAVFGVHVDPHAHAQPHSPNTTSTTTTSVLASTTAQPKHATTSGVKSPPVERASEPSSRKSPPRDPLPPTSASSVKKSSPPTRGSTATIGASAVGEIGQKSGENLFAKERKIQG